MFSLNHQTVVQFGLDLEMDLAVCSKLILHQMTPAQKHPERTFKGENFREKLNEKYIFISILFTIILFFNEIK